MRRRVLSASCERDGRQLVQLAADDLDVAALEHAHLEQLGIRERRLQRPAAGEDRDLLDAAGLQHLDRVVGRVGDRELRRCQREHPRDVDRDVAGSDDDRLLGLQVDLQARSGRGGRCTRRRTRSAACEPRSSSPGIPSRLSIEVPSVYRTTW